MNIATIEPNSEQHGTVFTVVFWIILTLASTFSGFTTYLGFSKDLPIFMSIPIAIIVGLGLFGINWQIREETKKHERSLVAPLLVFLIVFVFSFVSNTNAFYSRLVESDIVRETQEDAWLVFDSESTKAKQLVEDHPTYQDELTRISSIENEITNLKRQITDPRNPGLGELAREHLENIERLLGTTVTERQPPSAESPMSEHVAFANDLDNRIRELIDERTRRGVVVRISMIHHEIEEMRNMHRSRVDNKDFSRSHTDEMHRDLKSIESEVNSQLSIDPPLVLQEINDRADEVGKFKNTWRNFVAFVSPVAIVLSVVLGALLDLLAPFMSLAFRPRY